MFNLDDIFLNLKNCPKSYHIKNDLLRVFCLPAIVRQRVLFFQTGKTNIFSKYDGFKKNYTHEVTFGVENQFSASSQYLENTLNIT